MQLSELRFRRSQRKDRRHDDKDHEQPQSELSNHSVGFVYIDSASGTLATLWPGTIKAALHFLNLPATHDGSSRGETGRRAEVMP